MAQLTKEESRELERLTKKMGIKAGDILSPDEHDDLFSKTSSSNSTPLHTDKYEVIDHKCKLCGSKWESYFAMQAYTDKSLRSKKIPRHELPESARVEILHYKHTHCSHCKEILINWKKEDLVDVLIADRASLLK